MAEVHREAVIAAPPPVVWDLLVDPEYMDSWFFLEMKTLSADKIDLGARSEVVYTVGGKELRATMEVTEYQEGRSFTQRMLDEGGQADADRPSVRIEVVPHGTGAEVTSTVTYPAGSGMGSKLFATSRAHLEAAFQKKALERLGARAVTRVSEIAAANEAAPEPVLSEGISESDSTGTPPDPESSSSSAEVQTESPHAEIPPAPPMPRESSEVDGPTSTEKPSFGESDFEGSSNETAFDAVPPAPPMPEEPLEEQPKGTSAVEAQPAESRERTDYDYTAGISEGDRKANQEKPQSQASGDLANSITEALSKLELGEPDARKILTLWAAGRPLVDGSVFEAPFEVEVEHRFLCLVVRLVETRGEEWVHSPANQPIPKLPTYSSLIESVEASVPTDFEERSWQLIKEGSEKVVRCPANCSGGQQHCHKCMGGQVACPPCLGSGQQTKTEHGPNGQRYERRYQCSFCAGSGRQPCRLCRGSGWLTCSTCGGSSEVFEYLVGRITNSPEVKTFEGQTHSPGGKKMAAKEWSTLHLSPGLKAPDGLPGDLAGTIDEELAAAGPNERLRKLEIRVLPTARIRLADLPEANIRIVGESKQVVASKISSKKRVYVAWTLAVVLAIAGLIGYLVLSNQGGSTAAVDGGSLAANGGAERTLSAEQLEAEIASQVGFIGGGRVDDIVCGGEVSTAASSEASCTVTRPDGLEIPIVATYAGENLRVDVPSWFSG